MSDQFTLDAISAISDPSQIRVVLFINNRLVHAPLSALLAELTGVTGTATYDPGNLADGQGVTTTVTVTGALLGDYAEASFSLDLQGIALTAWVSAADTVSVRFQNETGAPIDLASGTIKARAHH